jgi:hypothetical protein
MKDEQEAVSTASATVGDLASDAVDRTFLLQCRLDQLHSALQSARAEADQARTRLAESAAREADYARRASDLHTELAAAREELAALHRRLDLAEVLRAEAEGRLFESGARDEAAELARLRREVRDERRRADRNAERLKTLGARIEELTATRETLLTRVAEWQNVVRQGDPDAIDLSEFISALRGDILELEHQNALAAGREAELREQLERAGVATRAPESTSTATAAAPVGEHAEVAGLATDPTAAADAPTPGATATEAAQNEASGAEAIPTEGDLATALAEAGGPDRQIELLRILGRNRAESAFYAIRRWATAPEPRVRAAAFEALGRHLEDDPARLEPHLRWGLADADPRVRRRVVLAAVTARGVAIRPLLEPLRLDPDPQVRRVIHEVLRRTSSQTSPTPADEAPLAASAGPR